MEIILRPIGTIHSPWTQAKGTPIQPVHADQAVGTVEVNAEFAAGLADLEGFDRIWLVYWFHQAPPARMIVTPFMDDTSRGLFSTRAPCRPNPIGLSPVRLVNVEGCRLEVADIDVLDGTPLLDIKPYAPRFDHLPVERSGWLDAANTGRQRADDRFSSRPPSA